MPRLISFALLLVLASSASAAILLQDDFESYADTAALNGVWPKAVGTDADTYLEVGANGPTWPGERCVRHTLVAARRDRNFTPTELVSSTDYILWEFDYYDFVGNTADPRQYGQLIAYTTNGGTTVAQTLAMGQYNAATNHNRNKYQARVAYSGPNWFNLNTNRSVGWHRFSARVYVDHVDFYVDGLLDTANVAANTATSDFYAQARIGSGLSSAGGEARYDNYLVSYIPEPASMLLLSLGLLALRRR